MLGIDVSKLSLAAAFCDPASRTILWEIEVPNTPAGIARVLARTPAQTPLVVEPTGRYSLPLVQAATAAAFPVRLAQPRRAKAFLSALHPRAKTDRLDSRGLARYGVSADLPPYPLKTEVMDQLDQLLAARRGLSQALMQLRQQQLSLPYAAAALEPAVASLTAERTRLDQQIAQHTAAAAGLVPVIAALDAIPGVGAVTAATLASTLRSHSFPTPDAFVAYVGLDVRVLDSGAHRGQRKVSRQGNAELRRLLYLCAQASLRAKDSPFKAQYERERAKGLTTTAALVAVARKLAKVAWSLVRHGTAFDPGRVYQQP
jgi:transposase